MTWIRTANGPAVAAAVRDAMEDYPPEYGAASRERRDIPEIVQRDSIVSVHSLLPEALRGIFSGYAAMLQPEHPLTRRQHEMIAVVVSAINDCFY